MRHGRLHDPRRVHRRITLDAIPDESFEHRPRKVDTVPGDLVGGDLQRILLAIVFYTVLN